MSADSVHELIADDIHETTNVSLDEADAAAKEVVSTLRHDYDALRELVRMPGLATQVFRHGDADPEPGEWCRAVMDRDGDVWIRRSSGGWSTTGDLDIHSAPWASVLETYGPLVEVMLPDYQAAVGGA